MDTRDFHRQQKRADERHAGKVTRPPKRFRELLVGVALTVVLIFAKVGFEKTSLGEMVEEATYAFLQEKLITPRHPESPPVMVVDIRDIPPEHWKKDGRKGVATSRSELQALLDQIAKAGPLAVAIDIDFSPIDEEGRLAPYHPDDPGVFFPFCRDLRKRTKIPIWLGVSRSSWDSPDQWLAKGFSDLAVWINQENPPHRAPLWLQRAPNEPRLPSMSAALARKLGSPDFPEPDHGLFALAAHRIEHWHLKHGREIASCLIDYSPLETLIEHHRVRIDLPSEPGANSSTDFRERLHNCIVLVGDGTVGAGGGGDTFLLWGVYPRPVPGIYVHACAALTLHDHLLYELTGAGRLVLDALISLGVLGAVTGILIYLDRKMPGIRIRKSLLTGLLTTTAIVAVWCVGYWLVTTTRLMWVDFVIVSIVLTIHRRADKWLEETWPGFWDKAKAGLSRGLQSWLSEPEEKKSTE